MPIEMISHRERVVNVRYSLSFEWESTPGAGYGFDCDENGNVDVSDMSDLGRENYEMCLRGVSDSGERIIATGISIYENTWMQPAIGRCYCGSEVRLSQPHDNQCDDCGRWFNMSGQELNAPDWARGCRCGSDSHGGDCMCFEDY